MAGKASMTIKCKKCGHTFQPRVHVIGPWRCPSCEAKNPNLKRHYRSVADVCILGLIATAVIVTLGFRDGGLTLGVVLSAAHGVLLLVTAVLVYKSKTPWTDTVAKTLIWIVFSLAVVFNVVLLLVVAGKLNLPAAIIYAVVFPYLFWLDSQANKCTASQPPPTLEDGQA